jgi:hypothetical protein
MTPELACYQKSDPYGMRVLTALQCLSTFDICFDLKSPGIQKLAI